MPTDYEILRDAVKKLTASLTSVMHPDYVVTDSSLDELIADCNDFTATLSELY